MPKHVLAIGWTSVCLSVCPSVHLSHAGIVSKRLNILSCFLHHTIAQSFWFCVSTTSSRNFVRVTPCGGTKQRWGMKMSQFSTNTRHRYIAISQKWLKIHGYMQRGVLQALNPLSIHVTFTAIVPGRTKWRPKCAKNVLKWRTSQLTGLINGCMLRCV